MNNTYNNVREAFYSGNFAFTGNPETIKDLSFMVDEGYLAFEMLPIATKMEYHERLAAVASQSDVDAYAASGGGNEHVALKILVGAYLQRKQGFLAFLENERRTDIKKILQRRRT